MSGSTKDFEHGVFGDGESGLKDTQRTGTACPILHAAQYRGCRRYEPPETCEYAGLKIRCMRRRSFGRADQLDQSRQGANGRVGCFVFGIGTITPEPAGLEMNQAGIGSLDSSKVEYRTIRRVDIPSVDQDVAFAYQRHQPRCSAGITGIERDARLVEIEKCEPRALSLGREGRRAAKRVAIGRFDFLDGRAEIGEQPGAIARRGRTSDLDNP